LSPQSLLENFAEKKDLYSCYLQGKHPLLENFSRLKAKNNPFSGEIGNTPVE
jgi:hypothetical protein